MKKFFRAMICAALAAALAPACTGNLGEGEETEPVFPEKTKVTILPDGTVKIPFHANMDWTASIPDDDPEVTSYFILEDGAMTSYSVRGKAGDAGITVRCLAEEADFGRHSVEVSLTMGDRTEVIAEVTLESVVPSYSMKVADMNAGKDGFVSAAPEGEEFVPSFTGADLEDNAEIPMIWLKDERMYVSYIMIDANFGLKFLGEATSRVEFANTQEGTQRICTITSTTPDFGEGETLGLEIVSDDESIRHAYRLVIPAFVPDFKVYPVALDTYGAFEWANEEFANEGFIYTYSSEALTGETGTSLIWPDGNDGYAFHLLVDSNFEYEITSAPEWLTWTQKESSGSRTEYDLDVDISDYSLDTREGELVIDMKGYEGHTYKYKFVLPGCKDLFRSTMAEKLIFNAEGQFQNTYGDYQDGAAFGNVTSTAGLVFYFFNKGEDRAYTSEKAEETTGGSGSTTYSTSWINLQYTWDIYGSIVQSIRTEISVETENFTVPREGLVVALPASVAEQVQDPADILSADRLGVASAYSDYILTYIQQGEIEQTGVIFTVEGDAKWAVDPLKYVSFTELSRTEDFEALDEKYQEYYQIFANGGHVYKLTYHNWSMSEGSTFWLTVNGDFSMVMDDAQPNNIQWSEDSGNQQVDDYWLTISYNPLSENRLYVMMGTNIGKKGDTGVLKFYDSSDTAVTAIICERDYSYNGN